MRWLMAVLGVFVIGSLPPEGVTAQTAVGPSDEAAVRDIVRRYTEARALNDPKAIEALFTDDADQYTTSGDWRRGMSALVKGMLETSARNPGTRAIAIHAVRFVTPDVAIVDGEY